MSLQNTFKRQRLNESKLYSLDIVAKLISLVHKQMSNATNAIFKIVNQTQHSKLFILVSAIIIILQITLMFCLLVFKVLLSS